ncbi:MAG: efflux transporter periplasmic adaptor subunit [Rhodobacterales bacterium]|nr:MAG: efflux transporter periplasmic adaptor subunit [Rhodobacterales bacterium]
MLLHHCSLEAERPHQMRLTRYLLLPIMAALWGAAPLAAQQTSPQSLGVELITITPATGHKTLSLTGEVQARDEVDLSFPMGGRLMSLLVREGDTVKRGQELARLESVQQEQAMRGAQAALDAARADLVQAKEEFERQDVFLQRGATTRTRRDEAERRFRITEASVERAQAQLSRAKKTYQDSFLRASADGTITARLADPGEVIPAARPVLKLALGAAMDAVFAAPESLPGHIPPELTVSLSLLDNPDVTFQGHVRKVSPLVDPRRGTIEVKIGIVSPPKQLSYGAAVRASLSVPQPDQITVPFSALSAKGDRPALWVVDPGSMTATLRPVTIARYSDDKMVISEGVNPGEIVVSNGAQLVYPGRVVHQVKQEEKP